MDLPFVLDVQERAATPSVVAQYGAWDRDLQRQATNPRTIGTYEILLWDGRPVGARQVVDHPDALELMRIYVHPDAQGQGVGTAAIDDLLRRADREARPVRLKVLAVNPRARALYERLGFTLTGETPTHHLMTRSFSPPDDASGS